MILDGMLVQQVATGTAITDPESGRRFIVSDDRGVVQNGVLFVTPDRYRRLRENAAAAAGDDIPAPR